MISIQDFGNNFLIMYSYYLKKIILSKKRSQSMQKIIKNCINKTNLVGPTLKKLILKGLTLKKLTLWKLTLEKLSL